MRPRDRLPKGQGKGVEKEKEETKSIAGGQRIDKKRLERPVDEEHPKKTSGDDEKAAYRKRGAKGPTTFTAK
jgi:hypothetical protein